MWSDSMEELNPYEAIAENSFEEIFDKMDKNGFVSETEVLKYGEVLTDDEFKAVDWKNCKNKQGKNYAYCWIRVRIIKCEGKLFYHKTVNHETVEFKELPKEKNGCAANELEMEEVYKNGEGIVSEWIDTYDAIADEEYSTLIEIMKYDGRIFYSKMIVEGSAYEFKELM